MRYVSLFSGIEAATVAWEPLGWEPVAFSEVDPFCCEVLKHRFPEVPNLGDVTKIDWSGYVGAVDLVVGGSPCQSFSVAGRREGLAGESGLMYEYIRAVRELSPAYFVWENVPGAFSSEEGEAFRQLLNEMDELGYGMAWRVLDAQFFGVAQRRRRVFVVGVLGDGAAPAEVLFEPEGLEWDLPSGKVKREVSPTLRAGASGTNQVPTVCMADANANAAIDVELCGTLKVGGEPPICFTQNTRDEVRLVGGDGSLSGALCSRPGAKQQSYVVQSAEVDHGAVWQWPWIVRRLTPRECERLQGFPDDWTLVPYRGRPADEFPDSPRYSALGNSFAVPVVRWIGERIARVDSSLGLAG